AEPANSGGRVVRIATHIRFHALDGLLQFAGPHQDRSHLPMRVIWIKRDRPFQRSEGRLVLSPPGQYMGKRRLGIGKLRGELSRLTGKLIGSIQGSSPEEINVAIIDPG